MATNFPPWRVRTCELLNNQLEQSRVVALLNATGDFQDLRHVLTPPTTTAAQLDRRRARLKESLTEYQAALERIRQTELENRAATHTSELTKARKYKDLHYLTAPVAGVVNQLRVHTVGGCRQGGRAIDVD